MLCVWLPNILLLLWLALARCVLGTDECTYVGVHVEEDPDIQLTVDCSHTRALVTWRTPYPIFRLFMMYSCSDVPDVHTKSKFYLDARMGTILLESIDSNGSCVYSGCVEKIDYGFYIPVLFTNVNCSRTESQSDIPTTSPVKSSTYDLSHTETTSYSNAIPTPMMMNDHSASSGIIPTAVFEMATTQLPSSVYDMEQLDISPLPTSIEEERTGVKSKSQLLIILVPSLLLFITSILAIPCIIFSGYSRTRKKKILKRGTLDKLKYLETPKCIDTNNDSLFFLTAVESSVPHSISDVTLLDSLINPRSRESRKQGKEHKQSAQSLNLGVLERGLETERYVLGPKNESLIDWSRASCEVAGTSEDGSLMKVAGTSEDGSLMKVAGTSDDGSLMKVAGTSEDGSLMKATEGFICVDGFLHKSLFEGGDVIVMRTKLDDFPCSICEYGSGYESSSQKFNHEDIHHDDLFRCHYQLDGTYFEYSNSSVSSDEKCYYSLSQVQWTCAEEEEKRKRMTTDNLNGILHVCTSTRLTSCIGTSGMRKHSRTENDSECEEAVFPTDAATSSCESFDNKFGINIMQSLASTPPDDSGFNSIAGHN